MLRTRDVALALFCLLSTVSYSQCITPPPLDDCQGTEPLLTDHEILGAGAKKWFYGATTTFNQLTLRGGTLVVCGDITFNTFNFDSGTVVIRPGARLRIGGGAGILLRGNTAIYNYGTFEVTSNLVMDYGWTSAAKPNVLINVLGTSVFRMSNQYMVINNPWSYFVNNGDADFHGLLTDPGAAAGSVCLGNGSVTSMRVLHNRSKHPYVVPSGAACLQVLQYSQFYDTLSASPNLNVCLGNTHYSDASCTAHGCRPNAWGAPGISNFCGNCTETQLLTTRNKPVATEKEITQLTLWPNPFLDNLHITWPRPKRPLAIVLLNASGALVSRHSINTHDNTLTLRLAPGMPAGAYFVKILYRDEVVVKKLIKEFN